MLYYEWADELLEESYLVYPKLNTDTMETDPKREIVSNTHTRAHARAHARAHTQNDALSKIS